MLKVEGRWAAKIEELLAPSEAELAKSKPRPSHYKTKCANCEKPLIGRRSCDAVCQAAAYAAKVATREKVMMTCIECGIPFETIKSNRIKTICSNRCFGKRHRAGRCGS